MITLVSLPIKVFWLMLLLIFLAGCEPVVSDKVYSLKLTTSPMDSDWERAPVHIVSVGGGRLNKTELFPDVDKDTVHTSTASCHHGAKLPEPIDVEFRSFYTDSHLYLQLSWRDATPDQTIRQWRYDGEKWQVGNDLEDGFGILWASRDQFQEFTCARACHLDDFGVQLARFHAKSRMRLVAGQKLDLWNWKAERTGRFGFADDRYLDKEGMHGDLPGEIFRENSKSKLQNDGPLPFTAGDRPVYAQDNTPLDTGFTPAGTVAPGYLTETPSGDRADVSATGRYEDGRWVVMLRRKLKTGSTRDVEFIPGVEVGFGLSIMDNTLYDHYASKHRESLLLLPAED